MIRTTTYLVLILMLPLWSNGQKYHDFVKASDNRNFYKIVAEVESYYASRDKGRGSGYKQFLRWKYFNSSRLAEDGTLQSIAANNFEAFVDFESSSIEKGGRPASNAEWKSIGAFKYDGAFTRVQGTGRVDEIVVNPNDTDMIFVGTPTGSLWKTTDRGRTWKSLTDGLTSLGISGIAVDWDNPNIIYMATGDHDSKSIPSMGVFKSVDGGETWRKTVPWDSSIDNIFVSTIKLNPRTKTLFVATTDGLYLQLTEEVTTLT